MYYKDLHRYTFTLRRYHIVRSMDTLDSPLHPLMARDCRPQCTLKVLFPLMRLTIPARALGRSLNILLEASVPGRHTHCVPWVNYCSYGQLTKPPGGVLENFLQFEVRVPSYSGGGLSWVLLYRTPLSALWMLASQKDGECGRLL